MKKSGTWVTFNQTFTWAEFKQSKDAFTFSTFAPNYKCVKAPGGYEFVKALGWATDCKICLIKIFSSPILATSLSAYGKIRRKKAMIVTDVNSLEPGRTAVVGDEIKKKNQNQMSAE